MAASQAAHEGSIPFTRSPLFIGCWALGVERLLSGQAENIQRSTPNFQRSIQKRLLRSPMLRARSIPQKRSRFAAEEFSERLKKFVRKLARLFSEVVQLLRELHLFAAVNFAGHGWNFVLRQIGFVGSAGRFATGCREMI